VLAWDRENLLHVENRTRFRTSRRRRAPQRQTPTARSRGATDPGRVAGGASRTSWRACGPPRCSCPASAGRLAALCPDAAWTPAGHGSRPGAAVEHRQHAHRGRPVVPSVRGAARSRRSVTGRLVPRHRNYADAAALRLVSREAG
jgi:hypothetical protein